MDIPATGWATFTNSQSILKDNVTGTYYLWIKASDNAGNNIITKSNAFVLDNTAPTEPKISPSTTTLTNSNVEVSITYSNDTSNKQYSLDNINWYTYTTPIIVNTNNTNVYAIGIDICGNISTKATLNISNIDKDAPTVVFGNNGANNVKIATTTVNLNDVGVGGINNTTLKYVWDTQNSISPTSGWTTFANSEVITKTNVTGTYYLWIMGSDNVGNSVVTKSNAFVLDNTPPNVPVLTPSTVAWTNSNVSITITYPSDVVLKQYSLNGTTWSTYTSVILVSTNNTTIYARGQDAAENTSSQSTLTISNIDKVIPTVAFGTNGSSNGTAITTVTASDTGGSGINTGNLQYVWDTQNNITPSSGWTSFTNGSTITKDDTDGTYYLWIKALDNAGNISYTKSNSFQIILFKVNVPEIITGMTPIKWDTSGNVVTTTVLDSTWYDYENKKWANAQTADGSMWVWIPRYEYNIPTTHSNIAQTIEINFLENISLATSGYKLNPAFTFGTTELKGIWVAKFEASGSVSKVTSKTSVTPLKNITINDIFIACRNMEKTYGAQYGWGTSGTGIDTHLIKNTEWGAVAYLSNSIYGKNSEIWINPNSSYLTGQAGKTVNASSTTTTYAYNNTTYGINASTTGNFYGIYDMNGGAWEYTAAYLNNGTNNLSKYGASLINAENKYKNIYISVGNNQNGNYLQAANMYGDAIYETSNSYTGSKSWYNEYSNMSNSTNPFFKRSGLYNVTSNSGIFAFYSANGNSTSSIGFRPTLLVGTGL